MNIKSYITITATVFSAVALLHLMRIISGESVIIGGWNLPITFNWVGMVITAFLAYQGFRLSKDQLNVLPKISISVSKDSGFRGPNENLNKLVELQVSLHVNFNMSVISIRIKDQKQKLLKIISSLEGRTIGSLVEEWVDEYIEKNKKRYQSELEKENLTAIMKISEPSFMEWDNEEDDVYNDL